MPDRLGFVRGWVQDGPGQAAKGKPMVDAKVLLPLALAALSLYVIDNARRIERLKADNSAANSAGFFMDKITRQFLAILLMPAACLLLSSTFGQALHPGLATAGLATRIAAMTGFSARGMESLLSLKAAALALLGVLLVEAIPLIHRSKSPILLGDFSVLLPRSGVELIWCAMLAAMAGIGEELLFRGFLPLGIAAFHVPFATALSISVVIFGACHLYQGPIGVVATGFAGAVLTGAYVLTGSLLFAMAVHVAIDVLGLVIRPLSRMGLRVAFRRLT